MNSQEIIKKFQEISTKITQDFKVSIQGIRTSRPNTLLVENIKVESYGNPTPLKQIASISIVPPNVIIVEPWDKNIINDIKKAISQSSLGVTPQVDNNQIKIYLPPLTQERKEQLIKTLNAKKEEYRIKLRKEREEVIEEIEKSYKQKEISEDEKFRLKEEVQKIIDKTNRQLDEYEEKKITEIRTS